MRYQELPAGYIFHGKIDLKNNKKEFWRVQGICFGVFIVFAALGFVITRYGGLASSGYKGYMRLVPLAVWCGGYLVYIVLHELTHGIFMYAFSKSKLRFGIGLTFAYCGSSAYFNKREYIIIALAPVVLWGIVFAVLNAVFLTGAWFFVIWMLQAGNIGGAAGDFYCTNKIAHSPKDILVLDTGTDMTIYRKATDEELQSKIQEEETL